MAVVYAADALHIVARQASSALPSTTVTPSDPAPTIPIPSPTPTGGGGATQSPLLFFVALGFGVVFTNLWLVFPSHYRISIPRQDDSLVAAQIQANTKA